MQRVNGLEQRFPKTLDVVSDLSWQDRAACLNEDPDNFFPEKKYDKKKLIKSVEEACGRCAVREQCLQYAIETGQTFGVWGGIPEAQVAKMSRSNHKLPARSLGYGYGH